MKQRRSWGVRATLLGVVSMVLASMLLAIGQAPAMACSCKLGDTNQQYRSADLVFTGAVVERQVVKSEKPRAAKPKAINLTVELDRIYKGVDPADDEGAVTVRTPGSATACGLVGLKATKKPVVFFATAKGSDIVATSCGGTASVASGKEDQVRDIAGEGNPVQSSGADLTASRTPVDTSETKDFTTLAAPGAAMVLVGFFGLVLVRWIGRRKP